jgi:hypothetical protein
MNYNSLSWKKYLIGKTESSTFWALGLKFYMSLFDKTYFTKLLERGAARLSQNEPFPFRPDTHFDQSHFRRFQIKLAMVFK